ncbi:DUF2842 domain-containing protein [Novosphingobium lentum]|uniref:DUF2842 domain-containing protein n=1 Tax=Novosphingobium lentum TaxID=145287 RepID=UPI00082E81AD|nr:DUF2842 domain-containing protein [Novosphingobium lentum]
MKPDWQPTWRKPVGILALLIALVIYVVVAVRLLDVVGSWPVLAQVPVYVVLGTIWLLPLRRYLIWMETGRFG